MHGSHRIVTENTLFAMPEASTSFFLPSLLDCFGVYLAFDWHTDTMGRFFLTIFGTIPVLFQL
nr:enoyl-CoA hydratase/isomerase family protein [Bartonella quintana]